MERYWTLDRYLTMEGLGILVLQGSILSPTLGRFATLYIYVSLFSNVNLNELI